MINFRAYPDNLSVILRNFDRYNQVELNFDLNSLGFANDPLFPGLFPEDIDFL